MAADIKISQLTAATSCTETDTLLIIQNGTNKKVSTSTFLNSLNSNTTIQVNPNRNAVATIVSGVANANLLNVDGVHNVVGVKTASPDSTVDLHVAGHIRHDGAVRASYEIVNSTTALSVNYSTSLLATDTGRKDFTLSAGFDGQIKNIIWESVANTATPCTITCNALLGAATGKITLNTVGEGVTLQYVQSLSKWVCIGVNNLNGASNVAFS